MSYPQFDIIFRGLRQGFDPSFVKEQFAILFRLTTEKVERIFKSKNVTLKHRADERLANIFIARLFAIGVLVDKVKLDPLLSRAIYVVDVGEVAVDSYSMHQPVASVYGDNIRRIPFIFDGKGLEYCKLWLVNLLVCLLSAGILYPWAQVRSLRYFYRHTQLDGSEFEYAANPQNIFLLQFVLMMYFVGLTCMFFQSLFYFFIGILILVSVLPFYYSRYNGFQQKYSYYRNTKFRQTTSTQTAYIIFLGWPIIVIFSAGLLAPYAAFKIHQYWAQTKSLGNFKFSFSTDVKKYFVLLPSLIVAELLTIACAYWASYLPAWFSAGTISFVYLWVFLRWRVALANLQWNGISSTLGCFVCQWDLRSYSLLVVKNIFWCCITLGFYWPWAKIALAQYKATHLSFHANQRFSKWSKKALSNN